MSAPAPPPALTGLPIVGHALEYSRDPMAVLWRGYREHGKAFSIRLGPKPAAVFLGPENQRAFFAETDRRLSISDTFQWVVPLFGADFPLAAHGAVHKRVRAELRAPLSASARRPMLPAIAEEVDEWLDGLGERGELELVSALGPVLLHGMMRALAGTEPRERLGDDLWRDFRVLTRLGSDHLARKARMKLPLAPWRRSKERLDSTLREIVRGRRTESGRRADYLQTLVDATSDDDLPAKTLEGLVWGGLPTTWGHAAWTLTLLLEQPHYRALVVDALDGALASGEPAELERVTKLERLDRSLKEAERLRPSVLVMGRTAVESIELGGHLVPRGWLVLISPAVSHRLPEVYSDPDRYDPDRFSAERPERARDPFALVGFGGGGRRCLGKEFALDLIKVTLALFLHRYELQLLGPAPMPKPGPDPNRPREPVRVRYRRRGR